MPSGEGSAAGRRDDHVDEVPSRPAAPGDEDPELALQRLAGKAEAAREDVRRYIGQVLGDGRREASDKHTFALASVEDAGCGLDLLLDFFLRELAHARCPLRYKRDAVRVIPRVIGDRDADDLVEPLLKLARRHRRPESEEERELLVAIFGALKELGRKLTESRPRIRAFLGRMGSEAESRRDAGLAFAVRGARDELDERQSQGGPGREQPLTRTAESGTFAGVEIERKARFGRPGRPHDETSEIRHGRLPPAPEASQDLSDLAADYASRAAAIVRDNPAAAPRVLPALGDLADAVINSGTVYTTQQLAAEKGMVVSTVLVRAKAGEIGTKVGDVYYYTDKDNAKTKKSTRGRRRSSHPEPTEKARPPRSGGRALDSEGREAGAKYDAIRRELLGADAETLSPEPMFGTFEAAAILGTTMDALKKHARKHGMGIVIRGRRRYSMRDLSSYVLDPPQAGRPR